MGDTFPSQDAATFWDSLHEQPRFRPIYPSEHVVRFLMQNYRQSVAERKNLKALDIGVGGGRHTKTLCEMGFEPYGIDISMTGLRYTRGRVAENGWKTELIRASMDALPFSQEDFDAVMSLGVFYYGTEKDMRRAIEEIHRVLKTAGKAFIVLRTTDDYRFGKGNEIEENTFCLQIRETNEYGTIQHFLTKEAVLEYFSLFSRIAFEKTETTFMQRSAKNSDWLITAEK